MYIKNYYYKFLLYITLQIIVVPYNTLLHKSTRKASGLKLKGNIVIIDEAHNLLESIGQMHSCEINGQQVQII